MEYSPCIRSYTRQSGCLPLLEAYKTTLLRDGSSTASTKVRRMFLNSAKIGSSSYETGPLCKEHGARKAVAYVATKRTTGAGEPEYLARQVFSSHNLSYLETLLPRWWYSMAVRL